MADISVRTEVDADRAAVHAIQEAAFGQSQEADLVDALRRAAQPQISLVAEIDAELAGHIFLSPVTIDGVAPAAACAGLAPVGVAPHLQGRGVGGALIRESLRRCEEVGWRAVFLLGDPGYYSRFGFVLAAPHGYHYESEIFDSGFQLLELEAGALAGGSGFVRYHEAFAEL